MFPMATDWFFAISREFSHYAKHKTLLMKIVVDIFAMPVAKEQE